MASVIIEVQFLAFQHNNKNEKIAATSSSSSSNSDGTNYGTSSPTATTIVDVAAVAEAADTKDEIDDHQLLENGDMKAQGQQQEQEQQRTGEIDEEKKNKKKKVGICSPSRRASLVQLWSLGTISSLFSVGIILGLFSLFHQLSHHHQSRLLHKYGPAIINFLGSALSSVCLALGFLPQIYLMCQEKSSHGLSLGLSALDFTGSALSIIVLLLAAAAAKEPVDVGSVIPYAIIVGFQVMCVCMCVRCRLYQLIYVLQLLLLTRAIFGERGGLFDFLPLGTLNFDLMLPIHTYMYCLSIQFMVHAYSTYTHRCSWSSSLWSYTLTPNVSPIVHRGRTCR